MMTNSFSSELNEFKNLIGKVYRAYYARHSVSGFLTFEEALPYIHRTLSSWSVMQFLAYAEQLELQNEIHHRSQNRTVIYHYA